MNFGETYLPPNSDYLLGTDQFGRDVLSRLIWGTRVSLFVGFLSTGIASIIGITLGSIAGYTGGKIDEIIMRLVEIFMMIPTFFLILTVVTLFGSSIWNVMLILGFTGWPGTARMIRAEFLSIKEKEFVEAAKMVGLSNFVIAFSEILPNAIFPAIVNASMRISGAIMTESSLSFLGLGDPNQSSWGWMLNDAMKSFRRAWWLSTFPGLAITITVISFNLIGDGLNDALNPHLKER
jgi:peptide/nickel transport system permease protein